MEQAIEKLKLVLLHSFTEGKEAKICVGFERSDSWYSLFSVFLLNCGFRDTEYFDDGFMVLSKTAVQHFKNKGYEIDVVFAPTVIVLLIKTQYKKEAMNGIAKMTDV